MSAVGTHIITIGDTLLPLNAVLRHGDGDPINLASYTVSVYIETQTGTVELAETQTGVTAHPTQAFTAEADDDYITCNAHGLKDGDQIIVANSGGALPTGLSAATRYWPINITPNKFQVATLPDGPAINITADGSGTNTFYIIGSVQMDFAAGQVDTAGIFHLWFVLSSGGEKKHLPEGNRWFEVRVVGVGN